MVIRKLNPNEHRLCAVALLFIVLMSVYFGIVGPLIVAPQQDIGERMEALRDTAHHYENLLAQRSALQKRSAHIAAEQQRDPLLLSGNDPTQVAAQLVDRLGAIVDAHANEGAGCVLNDKTPIAGEADGSAFQRIKVNMGLDCSIEPLAHILSDVQYAKPYLFVENLTVSRADDAPAHGPAGKLHVQLTVDAYMHAPQRHASTSVTANSHQASGNADDNASSSSQENAATPSSGASQ